MIGYNKIFYCIVFLLIITCDTIDKPIIHQIDTPMQKFVINDKLYSVKLYKYTSSMASSFIYLTAEDSNGAVQFRTNGIKYGPLPKSARITVYENKEIEIHFENLFANKLIQDTLKLVPEWIHIDNW